MESEGAKCIGRGGMWWGGSFSTSKVPHPRWSPNLIGTAPSSRPFRRPKGQMKLSPGGSRIVQRAEPTGGKTGTGLPEYKNTATGFFLLNEWDPFSPKIRVGTEAERFCKTNASLFILSKSFKFG